MTRMIIDIQLGISKEASSIEMTPENSKCWDQFEKEIRDIENDGGIVDIPPEFPG